MLAPKIERLVEMGSEIIKLDSQFDAKIDERHIRLGTVEYGAMLLAPILVEILQHEAPKMSLSIETMRRADLIEGVRDYGLDLAVSSFFGGVGELDSEPLYEDQYVVVGRKGNPSLRDGLSLEDYVAAEHMVAMVETHPPVILEAAFAKLGITRKIALTVPLYLAGLAAAERSDYLLTIHERLAIRFAPKFGLEIHPLPIPPVRAAATLITHPLARHDPGLLWFRKKLAEAVGALFADPGAGINGPAIR
jgi:DNA-binding transcriptional LysR family regulator